MAKQMPDGFHSVNSAITVRDGAKMLEFYRQAFGAEELMRIPGPDGKSLMHGEVKIGDCIVMISDEQPGGCRAPLSVGAPTSYLYLYVPDVDKTFNQAVRAGAKVVMPVSDMFWGDRFGQVEDPSGHRWGLATHKEDVPRRYGQAREGVLRQDEPGQEVARMRDIHVSAISDAVKKLCMEANWELESDMLRAFDRALTTERSPAGKHVLQILKENAQLAKTKRIPYCQDTG